MAKNCSFHQISGPCCIWTNKQSWIDKNNFQTKQCDFKHEGPIQSKIRPYPLFEAMSARSSKRLRSLASTLLGDSDDEDMGSHLCPMCQKPSADVYSNLRAQIQNLEARNSSLQNEVFELRKKLAKVTLQLFEVQKFVVPLGGQAGPRTSPISEDSWVQDNPHLLDLPRMPQFLKELQTFDHKSEVFFRLCSQNATTASRILQHCEWVVHSLSKKYPAVYKIGITENVCSRWFGKKYSYKLDKFESWQGMTVVFVGHDSLHSALIESFLISRFIGRAGCRNCNPGGESAKAGPGPFFTYVVWRILTPPNSAQVATAEKKC